MQTAKLFANGRSQAVRLPAEFRFEGSEIFIRRDPLTGDVILSSRTGWTSWDEFLAERDLSAVPADFMVDRRQPPTQPHEWPADDSDDQCADEFDENP